MFLKNKKAIILGGISLVVLAISITLLFVFKDHSNKNNNTDLNNNIDNKADSDNDFDKSFIYTTNNNEITVTGLKGDFNGKELIIPASYKNMSIKNINPGIITANVDKITLPFIGTSNENQTTCFKEIFSDSVISFPKEVIITDETNVNKKAFSSLNGITSISFINTEVNIEDEAFSDCKDLVNLEINKLGNLGNEVLKGCTSLTKISSLNDSSIPTNDLEYFIYLNSICYIKNNNLCYKECSNKTTFDINYNINIDSLAYNNIDITEIVIPSNVKMIGKTAINSCDKLNSITIPFIGDGENNTYFGYIFGASSETENNDYVPETLKSITISEGVTTINDLAFLGLSNITNINFPNSLTKFQKSSISECTSLIYNENNNTNYLGNQDNPYLILISVNDPSLTEFTINENTKFITEYSFEDLNSLTKLIIPNNIISIGSYAFTGCENITNLYVSKSVKDIEYGAFYSQSNAIICFETEKDTYPNNIYYSYTTTYYNVNETNSTTIDGLTYLVTNGEASLITIDFDIDKANILSDVTINDITYPVKKINGYALANSNVSKCSIPQGITEIGSYAFKYCNNLTEIVIPNTVNSINYGAFYECENLKRINVPLSVSYIGSYSFYECSKLSIYCEATSASSNWSSNWNTSNCNVYYSLNLNGFYNINKVNYQITDTVASVINIDLDATEVVIPKTITINDIVYPVTSIKGTDFSSAPNFYSLYIPSSISSIKSKAFRDCTSLTIYCETSINPNWETNWNYSNRPVYENINDTNKVTIDGLDFVITDEYAILSRVNPFLTKVKIPNTITLNEKEYTVNKIGSYSTQGCNELETIRVPKTIDYIDKYGIYGTKLIVYLYDKEKQETWNSLYQTKAKGTYTNASDTNIVNIDGIDYALYRGDNPHAIITRTNNIFKNLDIPNAIFYDNISFPVTEIGFYAFTGNDKLETVTFPNTITNIQEGAFYKCTSLHTVSLPSSIATLNQYTFFGCSSLIDINTNDITTINRCVFQDCSSLKALNLSKILTIGVGAFYNCKLLKDFKLDNVTSIDYEAFYGCSSIESITIPNTIKNIGNYAFKYCYSSTIYFLGEEKDVTLSSSWNSSGRPYYFTKGMKVINGLTYSVVNDYAVLTDVSNSVNNKVKIRDIVTINDVNYPVKEIGSYAFRDIDNKIDVIIPDSIIKINGHAFYRCDNIVSIKMSNNIETIQDYAFYDSDNLPPFFLTSSIKNITDDCFINCSGIIFCEGNYNIETSYFSNADIYSNINQTTCTTIDGATYLLVDNQAYLVYVSRETYKITIPYSISNNASEYVVTNIDEDAFNQCNNLIYVKLDCPIKEIPYDLFYNCKKLSQIILPNTLTACHDDSFRNLISYNIYENAKYLGSIENPYLVLVDVLDTDLTEYTIHSDTKIIMDYAFEDCDNLLKIILPNGLKCISSNVFYDCDNIINISIPDSIQEYNSSYYYSDNLDFNIYEGIKYLGNDENPYLVLIEVLDYTLDSYTIHPNTKIISDYAFYDCNNLKSIVIPDSVTNIMREAFDDCNNLESITLSNNLKYIGNYAFDNCSSLKSLVIPDSVEFIGESVFDSCTSLTNITLGKGLKYIEDETFDNCTSLTEITIPSNVIMIGKRAFENCTINIHLDRNNYSPLFMNNWNCGNTYDYKE